MKCAAMLLGMMLMAAAPITDAAAQAALLAVTRGAPGIYNVAEDDGAVDMSKARHNLGFDPAFRIRHA